MGTFDLAPVIRSPDCSLWWGKGERPHNVFGILSQVHGYARFPGSERRAARIPVMVTFVRHSRRTPFLPTDLPINCFTASVFS